MAVSQTFTTILRGTGILFVILPQLSLGLLSDYKICGDSECESLLSRVQAIRDYHGKDCRFLSLKKGETIFVYHKLTGKREDLWAGSINKQFGYFPKDVVQEEQVHATVEKVVATQKSDFFCMDEFGYPVDSSHLDTDGDDEKIPHQETETTQTVTHTEETDAGSLFMAEDISTLSKAQGADSALDEKEDENKKAGDAAARTHEEAQEAPVAPKEQGGSASPPWLGSSVTGLLDLAKEEDPGTVAEGERKETQAESSFTSSVRGWLGLGGKGKPDDAKKSREGDRETSDSLTSTMTGWLGFGGEKAEKKQYTGRDIKEEQQSAEKFRRRRMSLDLEGSQLHEDIGTLDWLQNGLSSTLGFGQTNQEQETTIEREAAIQEGDTQPVSSSWYDIGIKGIFGFRKDKEVDERTGSGFEKTEDDETPGPPTGSGNVDNSQSQPALTQEERTDSSNESNLEETQEDAPSEIENVLVRAGSNTNNIGLSDSRKDNVLPEDAASEADQRDSSREKNPQDVSGASSVLYGFFQTDTEEEEENIVVDINGDEKNKTCGEESSEMEGKDHETHTSTDKKEEDDNREQREEETKTTSDTGMSFVIQSDLISVDSDTNSVGKLEVDGREEVAVKRSEIPNEINAEGDVVHRETSTPQISPVHSAGTGVANTEAEKHQDDIGHEGEGHPVEGSSEIFGSSHSANTSADVMSEIASEEDRRFSTSKSATQIGDGVDQSEGIHSLRENEPERGNNTQTVQRGATGFEDYILNQHGLKSAPGNETQDVKEFKKMEGITALGKQQEVEHVKQDEVKEIKEEEMQGRVMEIKEEGKQKWVGELKEEEKDDETEEKKEKEEVVEELKEDEKNRVLKDEKKDDTEKINVVEKQHEVEEVKEDERQGEKRELHEGESEVEMEDTKVKNKQEELKEEVKQQEPKEKMEEGMQDEVEEIGGQDNQSEVGDFKKKHKQEDKDIPNEEGKQQKAEIKEGVKEERVEELKDRKMQEMIQELQKEEKKKEADEIKEGKQEEKQQQIQELKEEKQDEEKEKRDELKEMEGGNEKGKKEGDEEQAQLSHFEISEMERTEAESHESESSTKTEKAQMENKEGEKVEEKEEGVGEVKDELEKEEAKENVEGERWDEEEGSPTSSDVSEEESVRDRGGEDFSNRLCSVVEEQGERNPDADGTGVSQASVFEGVERDEGSMQDEEEKKDTGNDGVVEEEQDEDNSSIDITSSDLNAVGANQRLTFENTDLDAPSPGEGGQSNLPDPAVLSQAAEATGDHLYSVTELPGENVLHQGDKIEPRDSETSSNEISTEDPTEFPPNLLSDMAEKSDAQSSQTPEPQLDSATDLDQVYVQHLHADPPVTLPKQQRPSPPLIQTSSHPSSLSPDIGNPIQTRSLSKDYRNLLDHVSEDETTLLTELFGRHKLQFLDYMLGSSESVPDDPDSDESILMDVERLLYYHRETLAAPSMRLTDAPQEDTRRMRMLIALQKLEMLLARVRETFSVGKSDTAWVCNDLNPSACVSQLNTAKASCAGESCSTHNKDKEIGDSFVCPDYKSQRDEWMAADKEKDGQQRSGGIGKEEIAEGEKAGEEGGKADAERTSSVSHPNIQPGSAQSQEGAMKHILDFAYQMAEDSTTHVHAVKELLTWLTVQVVSSLPDDIRPGPDLYGVPWEPVIVASLVGLMTVLMFICRCYSSVKSRMYRSKERWLAEQVAQLLDEKCKVLETLSKCQQEYDDLESSLRDSGVLAQTQKTEHLEVTARQLGRAKNELERDLEQLKDQLDQQREHRIEQERRIAILEESIKTTEEESKDLQSQEEQAQTTLKVYNMNSDRLQRNLETAGEENTLLQESNVQLRQQVEGWAERASELEAEMSRCEVAYSGMLQDVTNKDERITSLTDRLLRMKGWDSDLETVDGEERREREASNGTAGRGEENGRGDGMATQGHLQKVQKLIYAAKLNADLKSVEEDKDRAFAKLDDEVRAKEDLQESIKELENEKLSLLSESDHYSDQVQRLQQKLHIMTEMYQENELKLHRLLTVEEKERMQKEEKLNKADKNIALAMEELNNYRQRAEEMEEELEKTTQSYQTQMSAHEKKAHNNWLAARAADRELADIRRENALLRQKLTDTQFKLDALDKDPYALDSLARPLPFRAERSPYGPSPLGRPASETRAFLSPPTLMDGPPARLSPRVARGPVEPPGGQVEMERSGGPHSDSGSISPTWERDRRGPPPGPPGPLGPPGYMFPEPGGPTYRRPPPLPGGLGHFPPGPLHPRGTPLGPPHPADMAEGPYRENSHGPGEAEHRDSAPGDRRTPPEADPRMGGLPPPRHPMGPMDGPFPRRAPYGPPPPNFYPPRGPGAPSMMPMWAPPPPGMMFPPHFPPGGPPLPPPSHHTPAMRPPLPDGPPPPRQTLPSPPHSQPSEQHTSSPEDAI